MSMSVCLSVRPRAYLGNQRPNFAKFSVHVVCDRDSELLWRLSSTLCTSGFADDVRFF